MRLTRLLVIGSLTAIFTGPARAQTDRIEAAVSNLEWREIGPTIMGGRVADLAVVESNPAIFYVGTATGGVWRTTNNGASWEPLFDDQPTSSIGDVTLSQANPNLIWVGTGEPQNRQSSPWGNGVYKSLDGGRTWQHMGLEATRHIARIRIHPSNSDVVYVAAVGHLWGPNEERGVYRTQDGGRTWEKVLYVDEDTGAIDLVMDPNDPQTLFAAMYQRRRTGFGFNGGGPGSGIYRTTDGGDSWEELTEGLPSGIKGRIGLDIYRGDGNLVFAIVEADLRRGGFGRQAARQPQGDQQNGVYRSTDRGDTWEQMSTTNNRPMYYSQIRVDPNDPNRIYLGGSSLYRSSDGGRTFTNDASRGVHSDHHALWIDPNNSKHLILAGDGGVSESWDRSDSWRQMRNLPIAQFYQIGVNMEYPYHVCGGLQDNGSWCAPSATQSNQGIRNRDWYNVGSGDGFYNVIDPNDPTIMFAESQGGNITRVDLRSMEKQRIRALPRPGEDGDSLSYRFNWNAPIVISAHNPSTIYHASNHLLKSTDRGTTWQEISPDLTKSIDRSELEIMGVRQNRMLSRHDGISSYGNITTIGESPLNADLIYVGTDDGNLQVTRDGGATWDDITGRIRNLPDRTYVSRVVASKHNEGTVYATFDGHRNDDYAPYVYVSEDYGRNWRAITKGLPDGWSVNVITEHPQTGNLLFLGNEIGVYFSIDRGQNWVRLKNDLPTVPVDDIVVHPRENDLVLGTHGRGVWIVADISPLEELTPEVLASSAHLFSVRTATIYNPERRQGWTPGVFAAPEPQSGALIRYYLHDDVSSEEMVSEDSQGSNGSGPRARMNRSARDSGVVKITILDTNGETVRELEASGAAGGNEVVWDLRITPPYTPEPGEAQGGRGGGFFRGGVRGPRVLPGTYTVRLEAAGRTLTTDVVVRGDPRIDVSRADLEARQRAMMSAYQLAKPNYEAGRATRRLNQQLDDIDSLLREAVDVPEAIQEQVDSLRSELRELQQELQRAGAGAGAAFAIEASTTRPTADQLWQIEQSWEKLPGLIDKLNEVIDDKMPALYDALNEHGIRPDPGKPITVPTRSGR